MASGTSCLRTAGDDSAVLSVTNSRPRELGIEEKRSADYDALSGGGQQVSDLVIADVPALQPTDSAV